MKKVVSSLLSGLQNLKNIKAYFYGCETSLMKWILFFVIIFSIITCPASYAQSITHSQYNGFTGEHEIETSIVSLKPGFSNGFGVAYRAISGNILLSFIGYGKKNKKVTEDERLQFMLKNGTVVKFDSRVQLPSNESSVPNLYIHHYYISRHEVDALSQHPVVMMRAVSLSSVTEFSIGKKQAKDLLSLSKIFLKEMDKF